MPTNHLPPVSPARSWHRRAFVVAAATCTPWLAALAFGDVAATRGTATPVATQATGNGLLTPTALHFRNCCFATSIVTADLGGEGRTDIITGNGLSYDITVLRQNPLGDYADPVSLPLDGDDYGYVAIAAADLDGDGHVDLAAAGYVDNRVAIYLGDGQGGFSGPASFDAGNALAPWAIAFADVDADGHLDLVTANAGSQNLSVLLGDGAGGFAPAVNVALGQAPVSVALADLTDDGEVDIVTANEQAGSVSLLVGDGTGGFAAPVDFSIGPGAAAQAVALADVNADGKPDIVTANAGDDGSPFPSPDLPGSVSVLINNGGGAFAAPLQRSAGGGLGRADALAIGDVTADGIADIVVSRPNANSAAILAGDGAGGFAEAVMKPVGSGPGPIAISDATADGIADVIVANAVASSVSILPGDGAGNVGFAGNFAAGSYTHSVADADFDGDGHADIAAANLVSNDVSILLGDGHGGFAAEVRYAVGEAPTWITTGDVNEDGHADLVVANLGGDDVSILLGDGHGAFAPAQNLGVGGDFESPYAVALGDANGDGHLDIATANTNISNDSMSLLLGDGSGHFAAPALTMLDDLGFHGVQDVILVDVTGDGSADLVTANISSSDLALMSGDGSGSFAAPVSLPIDAGPVLVIAGDVSGDGVVDLVTLNQTSQSVSVLIGDGQGGFATPVNWPIYSYQSVLDYNPFPWGMALADIDGDGRLDIITANTQNDTVSVLPNSGNGTFENFLVFDTGANPGSVAIADVDGDGDLDVIVGDRSNDAVSVLINRSGAVDDNIFADGFDSAAR